LTLQHVLCEAAKQGAQSARLITDADNLIAQHLYRSEGFDVVDVMQRFILKRA
jgi:ribosomal protein S18 acetylase RimI-like enzyme